MEQELVVHDGTQLQVQRSTEEVMREATLIAKQLMRMVDQTKAFAVFGGQKYLELEAWQTVGQCYKLAGRIKEDRWIQYGAATGWEATAELVHLPSGNVISTATSMCMDDEENWSSRPKYEWTGPQDARVRTKVGEERVPEFQRRSMAQTRATAKAYRLALGWIPKLAGYAPVAAEEMSGSEIERGPREREPLKEPQAKTENGGGANVISQAQAKRLYAIAKENGWADEDLKKLIQSYGFESSKLITKDKYEKICSLAWPDATAGGANAS